MYIPAHNRIEDAATLAAFMRAHSFATLVTAGASDLHATHLPFLIDEEEGKLTLHAHMALANPQWRDFGADRAEMAIFMEPHAYVSPSHYEQPTSVPTWNYAAVHVYGAATIVAAESTKRALMERLIALHDAAYAARFPALPAEYIAKMLAGVVAFTIPVARLEARFKLSQEKLPIERARIIAALERSADTASQATAELMRRHGT